MQVASRFVVLVMKRILSLFTSQQLTVPVIFFVFVSSWQVSTGTGLLYRHSLPDICKVLVPYLATAWVLWCAVVFLAAKDLRRELNEAQQQLNFSLFTASGDPVLHRSLGIFVWIITPVFILLGACLPFAAIYEAFLAVEAMPINVTSITSPDRFLLSQVKLPDHHVVPAPTRSYIAVDGFPVFLGSAPPGPTHEGGAFLYGDSLAFNIHFKAIGPNPLTDGVVTAHLYLADDFKPETQRAVIRTFGDMISKARKDQKFPREGSSPMPGDNRFITATLLGIATEGLPPMSQLDLNNLSEGKKIVFALSEIAYKDGGATHHQRQCSWMQPPAVPPGVWHDCDPSGWKSD